MASDGDTESPGAHNPLEMLLLSRYWISPKEGFVSERQSVTDDYASKKSLDKHLY